MLITGASTGIGAATARRAAVAGYRVVLAARSTEKLNLLADDLGGSERALAVPCDVTDWAAQQALIASALDAFGRIDVAFANAGAYLGSLFLSGDDTPDEWREMVLTNVYGTAATARLVLPELIRRRGHLLLTGAVAGRVAVPSELYAATKWAVTAMAESIRRQVVGSGVRVSLIQPGRVDTPFFAERPNAPILTDDDIAQAVLFAMGQPPHVDVNEILIRPAGQQL
jgi:NADP-dependent 3-hydroxy acid dehydrogenase YdfG